MPCLETTHGNTETSPRVPLSPPLPLPVSCSLALPSLSPFLPLPSPPSSPATPPSTPCATRTTSPSAPPSPSHSAPPSVPPPLPRPSKPPTPPSRGTGGPNGTSHGPRGAVAVPRPGPCRVPSAPRLYSSMAPFPSPWPCRLRHLAMATRHSPSWALSARSLGPGPASACPVPSVRSGPLRFAGGGGGVNGPAEARRINFAIGSTCCLPNSGPRPRRRCRL